MDRDVLIVAIVPSRTATCITDSIDHGRSIGADFQLFGNDAILLRLLRLPGWLVFVIIVHRSMLLMQMCWMYCVVLLSIEFDR